MTPRAFAQHSRTLPAFGWASLRPPTRFCFSDETALRHASSGGHARTTTRTSTMGPRHP
jgi:hypothetical protein